MRHLINIFIITFVSLSSLIISTYVHANQIIDYATFTQLSRDKQIKVVKMLHEYVTFMEHTQLKSELQKNPSYTQYSQILNYFIQSAHADEDTVEDKDFIQKNGQACVYAGWVSYYVKTSKGGYCRHPKLIDTNKVNDAKLKDYLSQNSYPKSGNFVQVTATKSNGKTTLNYTDSKSCNNDNQIICSPTLFGTSTGKANGPLFCVEGNGKSYNSSYLCSQAVAKHKDSELILNGIIENALQKDESRKEFNYLLMSMYDTCMCKGTTGFMHERYAKAMFPSRTCFAWMYQTQRLMKKIVGSSCRSEFEKDNYGNLATVADWMESAAATLDVQINPITTGDTTALEYFDIKSKDDENFKASREASFEIYQDQNLCPLQLAPTVKIKIDKTDDPLWVKLTASLVGVTRKDIKGWNFALKEEGNGEIKNDGTQGDNVFLAKKSFDEYSVTATIKGITGENNVPALEAPVISIAEASRNDKDVTLSAEVAVPEGKKYTIEWSQDVKANKDDQTSATTPIKEKDYAVTATLKVDDQSISSNKLTISPTAIEPTIKISESKRDEATSKSILKAEVTVPKETTYTITWNNGPVAQENDQTSASADIKSEDYQVTATLKINGKEKEISSNPLTIKAIENDYSIKIEMLSETDEEGKFKAVVKNKDKVVDDAEIKWFKSKKKTAEKKKDKRSTGLNDGIADEDDEDDEGDKKDQEEEDSEEDAAGDDGLNTAATGDEDGDEKDDSSKKKKDGILKAGTGEESSIKKEKFDQMIFAEVNGVKSNELKLKKKDEEEKEKTQKKVNNSNPVKQKPAQAMPRQRQMRFNMGVR